MDQPEIASQNRRQTQLKLVLNLTINGLFPPLLYALLRPYVATDSIALALIGGVTAIWIAVGWLWRRRVNWISLFTLLGLTIAIVASQLLGGNALPLKLRGP